MKKLLSITLVALFTLTLLGSCTPEKITGNDEQQIDKEEIKEGDI